MTQVNRNEREAGLGWISVVCLTQRPFHIELHCIVVGNNFLSQELKGEKKKNQGVLAVLNYPFQQKEL